MSRKAKGKRPVYFNDPENDKLLAITMAVAGELSVLRERLDTIERLARAKGSSLWMKSRGTGQTSRCRPNAKNRRAAIRFPADSSRSIERRAK
jgi:hypothetical protein